MFRIDRNLVNLATARSIQVDGEEPAVSVDEPPNVSASAAYLAREMINGAEKAANKTLEDARNEAAAILLAARDEAEEGRRRAWQEGYAEGSNEGKRVANEECSKKMSEDDEMLKRIISELYEERMRTFAALEDDVIGLTLEIVKKIYGPSEEVLGGVFESLIRNALKQIAPEGKVIIRVSSSEYERFFSSGTAVFHLDKGTTITAAVLRDASLGEGDCIIDTDDETVNAGIDTQLKYIKIAFNRADD